MSNSSTSADPGGIEAQRVPLQEVGQAIYGALPADCEKIVLKVRKTRAFGQSELNAFRADGSRENLRGVSAATQAAGRLREAMYKPGTGTWFSAEFTVTRAGEMDADFDYDHEPDWSFAIDPIIYRDDLDTFPRDEQNIPDWLKAGLAAHEAGVTALGGRSRRD
jgi:hypothetical protein